MLATLDPLILEQEKQRMGEALLLLQPLTNRRGRSDVCSPSAQATGRPESELEDVTLSDFRRGCG